MILRILPGALIALAMASAHADTLSIPDNNPQGIELPNRGLSMEAVEERFGSPTRVIAAVGEPPITRWVYPSYTVYFEHEFVIHPVMRTRHTGHSVSAN